MRPLYVFLLARPHSPRALGFCSPPSSFVPQPLVPRSQLRSTSHAAPGRRTRQHATTSPTAASCGHDRRDSTRQQGSPLENVGAARRNPPLRWTGHSASTRAPVYHASSSSAVSSSRGSSSNSSRARGPRASASVVPADTEIASSVVAGRASSTDTEVGGNAADPTAAAHAYLSDFLGMTKEELQQLSDKYSALPATRRGPDEITMASPELAAAATRAAEAPAAAVTAAAGPVTAAATEAPATGGVGNIGGEDGGDGGREERRTRTEEVAVKAAADRAAVAAAGRLLIPEVPVLAPMLHEGLGVPKERVKRLLLKWPRLLEVSGYHLRECVEWLTGTLGLRQEEVANLVLSHPPLLIKSVSLQLQPNLYWLEGDLGLTRAQARRAVSSCPQLLAKCVSSNLMPKIKFLQDVVRYDIDGVSDLVLRYPQLFNFSLESMRWKARWLEEELMLDPYQVRRVLTRCPPVFAYSVERNLVPTLEFFLDDLGATKAQVREAVLRTPRLLGMSLEKRLWPRLQEIRKAGFTPSWELHHEVMLFASDTVFQRWLTEEPTGAAWRRGKAQGRDIADRKKASLGG